MPRTGRPTKLTSTIRVPDIANGKLGTKPEDYITTTVGDRIVELVALTGVPAHIAGQEAGVTARVVYKWIAEGRRHTERRDNGAPMIAAELRLCDFVHDLDQARARYIATQLKLHEDIAKGGLTIGEITEKVSPTERDDQGRPVVLERTVKQKRLLPDMKALHWNLERKMRELYAPRIEVTGAEGGPVEVTDTTEARARALLAAAQDEQDAYLRGVEDGRARQAEEEAERVAAE